MTEILEQLRATTFLLEKICNRHNINPEICNGDECCSAIDIIDENKRLINSNGWISVDERLPLNIRDSKDANDSIITSGLVLVINKNSEIHIAQLCDLGKSFRNEFNCSYMWFLNNGFGDTQLDSVVFWQPLPLPPVLEK